MQGVPHFDVQDRVQFIREISARGTIDESFGSGQQRAETRKPDVCPGPQSHVVKAGDFAQSIVSTAMRVTGEIIQRLELAEDGDVDRSAEGLLHIVESGDLKTQQKRAQVLRAVGDGSHNVIVPIKEKPPDRNYNKSGGGQRLMTESSLRSYSQCVESACLSESSGRSKGRIMIGKRSHLMAYSCGSTKVPFRPDVHLTVGHSWDRKLDRTAWIVPRGLLVRVVKQRQISRVVGVEDRRAS